MEMCVCGVGLGKCKMNYYLMCEEFRFCKVKNVLETGYPVKIYFILLSCTLIKRLIWKLGSTYTKEL